MLADICRKFAASFLLKIARPVLAAEKA